MKLRAGAWAGWLNWASWSTKARGATPVPAGEAGATAAFTKLEVESSLGRLVSGPSPKHVSTQCQSNDQEDFPYRPLGVRRSLTGDDLFALGLRAEKFGQTLEEAGLRLKVVVQDPLVPSVLQAIEEEAARPEPGGQRLRGAGSGGRGIEGHPSVPGEPDLDPRVGLVLCDREVLTEVVPLPPEKSVQLPGVDTQAPQENGHSGREVLTVPLATVEEKVLESRLPRGARELERVPEIGPQELLDGCRLVVVVVESLCDENREVPHPLGDPR